MKYKSFLLIIVLFVQIDFLFCQNEQPYPYIRNQFNVNIGKNNVKMELGSDFPIFSCDVLYGHNDWLELGAAFSCFVATTGSISNNQGKLYHPIIINYGVAAKAHLLPALIKPSFSIIDIYASGRLGSFMETTGRDPERRFSVFSGLTVEGSLGAAANITRHFGVFYEWGWHSLYKMTTRFGLNIRFDSQKK